MPLHEQHRPDFIFMDDNAPAPRGHIIRERLLEARVPQMEWPALSSDLNPTENLWDQLSRRAEGRNPAPQNLRSLREALQEEWDAMPHATFFVVVYPPLLLAFVSINCLRGRNYHCMLLKCPTFI